LKPKFDNFPVFRFCPIFYMLFIDIKSQLFRKNYFCCNFLKLNLYYDWTTMFMGLPGNCPACPCVKTAQGSSSHDTTNPPNRSLTKIFTQNLATDGIRTLELVVLLTGCPCGRKYTYDVITTTKVLI
jgi:hypothetical protein